MAFAVAVWYRLLLIGTFVDYNANRHSSPCPSVFVDELRGALYAPVPELELPSLVLLLLPSDQFLDFEPRLREIDDHGRF